MRFVSQNFQSVFCEMRIPKYCMWKCFRNDSILSKNWKSGNFVLNVFLGKREPETVVEIWESTLLPPDIFTLYFEKTVETTNRKKFSNGQNDSIFFGKMRIRYLKLSKCLETGRGMILGNYAGYS